MQVTKEMFDAVVMQRNELKKRWNPPPAQQSKEPSMKRLLKLTLTLSLFAICCGCVSTYESDYLKSWNKDAESYKRLVQYIEDWSPRFHPDKVAVFDFDGTLFCERDKTYFDWIAAARYIQDHPDKFSDSELRLASKVIEKGEIPAWGSEESALSYKVWAGCDLHEYRNAIRKYMEEPMPGFVGLKRKDALFKPMLEVIEYLQANGFRVFVCTGTDRWLVREILDGRVPRENIIGSDFEYRLDEKLLASNRLRGSVPIHTGNLLAKNLNEQKILHIWEEIGRRPDMVFGNSAGDFEMAKMSRSRVFMVMCDDTERDCGDLDEATAVYKECLKRGWNPISMRHDWKTIYGEGVRKK